MKKFVYPAFCLALICGAAGLQSVKAQDAKLTQDEEIIIKRKGDKDVNSKITIEIKNDKVTINGKPLEDYNDEELAVIKRKVPHFSFSTSSPFRSQSGTWQMEGVTVNGNKAFLGVSTAADDNGAKVDAVTKGSAAEKAGLQKGDIITSIDETPVKGPGDLVAAIGEHEPADKVTVHFKRDGKDKKETVSLGKTESIAGVYGGPGALSLQGVQVAPGTLRQLPELHYGRDQGSIFFHSDRPRLGITAQDTEEGNGVKVLSVDDESAAAKAGIKEDDIITSFDGQEIKSADDLSEAAGVLKDKSSVKVDVTRDGAKKVIEIKVPRKLKTTSL